MASSIPPNSEPPNQQDASARKALPFEPKKRAKKAESTSSDSKKSEVKAQPKKAPPPTQKAAPKSAASKAEKQGSATTRSTSSAAANRRAAMAVPDVVSKRMAKRMAIFCGVPSFLAIATFVVSYYIVSQHLLDLPTSAVLLVSLGFFGLGVLGLSYGLFSASWEEDTPGTLLGMSEFRTNLGRTISAWRSQRPQS